LSWNPTFRNIARSASLSLGRLGVTPEQPERFDEGILEAQASLQPKPLKEVIG
jgi:hypothetical protein